MIICRYIQRTLLLTMLLVLSASVFGSNNQVPVRIEIEAPSEVLSDEDFIIIYNIILNEQPDNNEVPEVDKFTDFEVVAGPDNKVSVLRNFFGEPQAIKLKTTYQLRAKKSGTCSLPMISYKLRGKTYKSEKRKINVINNSSKSRKRKELSDEDAFIRTIVSRKLVSPSDTLSVTYRLYSTVPIYGIEGIHRFPLPRYDFYFDDLTNYRQPERTEVYEGKEYFVKDIRVLILQPRGDGHKNIYGGSVELIYTENTGRKIRDRYGRIVDEVVYLKKELKIEDIAISVMDLIAI